MRILLASDLHYNLKQFDWLDRQSDSFDAVILAGDLLNIASHLDLNMQIEVIKKYLFRMCEKTHLFVCSGNHDGNEKNAHDEFIAPWLQEVRSEKLHVDGDSIQLGDTLFTVFPWWDGDVTKQEVASQLEEASKLKASQWFWIYHAPPDESPTSWTGKRFIGDRELNQWLDQYHPDLVVTGHIHESPFKNEGSWHDQIDSTWVFNAGNNIGEVPAHIVFDMNSGKATWVSLAGVEEVSFL